MLSGYQWSNQEEIIVKLVSLPVYFAHYTYIGTLLSYNSLLYANGNVNSVEYHNQDKCIEVWYMLKN
jgi:hypothetical protein